MSTAAAHRVPHITVGHFYANHAETLGLRLEGASRGLNERFANRRSTGRAWP